MSAIWSLVRMAASFVVAIMFATVCSDAYAQLPPTVESDPRPLPRQLPDNRINVGPGHDFGMGGTVSAFERCMQQVSTPRPIYVASNQTPTTRPFLVGVDDAYANCSDCVVHAPRLPKPP